MFLEPRPLIFSSRIHASFLRGESCTLALTVDKEGTISALGCCFRHYMLRILWSEPDPVGAEEAPEVHEGAWRTRGSLIKVLWPTSRQNLTPVDDLVSQSLSASHLVGGKPPSGWQAYTEETVAIILGKRKTEEGEFWKLPATLKKRCT